MRQGTLVLVAGRVRSKKKKGINIRNPITLKNTPRNPQQPGDREPFETAFNETRPTRYPYSNAASIDPGLVDVGLVCVHTYSGCCCAACMWCWSLFSRQRRFFLFCDIYLRFRGCPVRLEIERFVSAS